MDDHVYLVGGPHDGDGFFVDPACRLLYIEGHPRPDGNIPMARYNRREDQLDRADFEEAWVATPDGWPIPDQKP